MTGVRVHLFPERCSLSPLQISAQFICTRVTSTGLWLHSWQDTTANVYQGCMMNQHLKNCIHPDSSEALSLYTKYLYTERSKKWDTPNWQVMSWVRQWQPTLGCVLCLTGCHSFNWAKHLLAPSLPVVLFLVPLLINYNVNNSLINYSWEFSLYKCVCLPSCDWQEDHTCGILPL